MSYILIQGDMIFVNNVEIIKQDRHFIKVHFASGSVAHYKCKDDDEAKLRMKGIVTQIAMG